MRAEKRIQAAIRPWRILIRFAQCAFLTSCLGGATSTQAFDASHVPDGLYYNGTDVNEQIWTPLVLVEGGQLIDPLRRAQERGIQSLEGKGRTSMLQVNTSFLYGACPTGTQLYTNPPVLDVVPTVLVLRFTGNLCASQHETALTNLRLPADQRSDNPMPTFYVNQSRPESPPLWMYGVPGNLVGKPIPIRTWTKEQLGGMPSIVNGVVSRQSFTTLPIIEPDFMEIAHQGKLPKPAWHVGLIEAAHRGDEVVLTSTLLKTTAAFVKEQLVPRYTPALNAALAKRFGGITEHLFELGLIQGIDLDNSGGFDYVGVARIGAVTKAGPVRWVDVVWCWRSGLGQVATALTVLRTSEPELYDPANRYFSGTRPSYWSPHLVVSAIADFDKDKRLEIVTALVRPVGLANDVPPTPGGSRELWLRDSAIHTWEPDPSETRRGQWQEVYRTQVHEARGEYLNPKKITVERFGEQA